MARLKMTDEQKAAAKRLREAKKSRLAWEARQAGAAAAEAAQQIARESALAEVAAIRARQLAAAKRAKARADKAAAKQAPSALALARRRNAEARAAARLAARKAEEEARAVAAEKAARAAAASVRKPNADPVPASHARRARREVRATLRSPQAGLWEVIVQERRSLFVVPFYQYERPEPADVAQAVREEITRRRQMVLAAVTAAKPRKAKARAARSPEPRDTAKIRRIERQMEGV